MNCFVLVVNRLLDIWDRHFMEIVSRFCYIVSKPYSLPPFLDIRFVSDEDKKAQMPLMLKTLEYNLSDTSMQR